MEGLRVRIGEVEFRCVGQCCGDWVFLPLNQDNDEVVIYSEADIEAFQENEEFEILPDEPVRVEAVEEEIV